MAKLVTIFDPLKDSSFNEGELYRVPGVYDNGIFFICVKSSTAVDETGLDLSLFDIDTIGTLVEFNIAKFESYEFYLDPYSTLAIDDIVEPGNGYQYKCTVAGDVLNDIPDYWPISPSASFAIGNATVQIVTSVSPTFPDNPTDKYGEIYNLSIIEENNFFKKFESLIAKAYNEAELRFPF